VPFKTATLGARGRRVHSSKRRIIAEKVRVPLALSYAAAGF
jgi:hypothetical protein